MHTMPVAATVKLFEHVGGPVALAGHTTPVAVFVGSNTARTMPNGCVLSLQVGTVPVVLPFWSTHEGITAG